MILHQTIKDEIVARLEDLEEMIKDIPPEKQKQIKDWIWWFKFELVNLLPDADIHKLESIVDDLEDEITELESEKISLVNEIDDLEEEIENLYDQQNKLEIEIKELKKQLKDYDYT